MKLLPALGLIIISVIVSYFAFHKNSTYYVGIFYPDKSDKSNYVNSYPLDSLDTCRQWVNLKVKDFNLSNGEYTYICGTNCTAQSDNLKGAFCNTILQ